jgi:hypothetical protein
LTLALSSGLVGAMIFVVVVTSTALPILVRRALEAGCPKARARAQQPL